jgi:hypothetical protein
MASPGKKPFLLRLDPWVAEALQRWADDDLRSMNGQLDWILQEALRKAGRKAKPPARGPSGPPPPKEE